MTSIQRLFLLFVVLSLLALISYQLTSTQPRPHARSHRRQVEETSTSTANTPAQPKTTTIPSDVWENLARGKNRVVKQSEIDTRVKLIRGKAPLPAPPARDTAPVEPSLARSNTLPARQRWKGKSGFGDDSLANLMNQDEDRVERIAAVRADRQQMEVEGRVVTPSTTPGIDREDSTTQVTASSTEIPRPRAENDVGGNVMGAVQLPEHVLPHGVDIMGDIQLPNNTVPSNDNARRSLSQVMPSSGKTKPVGNIVSSSGELTTKQAATNKLPPSAFVKSEEDSPPPGGDRTHDGHPSAYVTPPTGDVVRRFSNKASSPQDGAPGAPSDKKLSIILYAKYRTGSTFASDYLNKHSDIFFTFEPLHVLNSTELADRQQYWISEVLNCRFKELYNILQGPYSFVHSGGLKHIWTKRVFCHKYGETGMCGNMPVELLEEKCLAHKHTATKVILVERLVTLLPFFRSGYKTIHLVRDPRGVFSSMLKIKVGKRGSEAQKRKKMFAVAARPLKSIEKYCESLREDVKMSRAVLARFNKPERSYILVRYEDLATDPTEQLRSLYDFLGIPPSTELQEWAYMMVARSRGVLDFETKKEKSFGTFRNNSTETALAWRDLVPWSLIEQVQIVCGDVMDDLGYVQLTKESFYNVEASVMQAIPSTLQRTQH